VADLDTITVEGWRGGPYGPGLDPATFFEYAAAAAASGSNEYDFSQFTQSFVAPVVPPSLLPPAVIEAPPAAAIAEVIVSATRAIAPVVGLLAPTPIAPEPYPGDLQPFDFSPFTPEPTKPLPEVKVEGVRPPAPPPVITPNDFLMPPNWNDLVHGYDFYYEWPYVPLGFVDDSAPYIGDDVGERPSTRPNRTPRSNPAPRRAPRTDAPRPGTLVDYGIAVAPDLVGSPLFDPFRFPGVDPSAEPASPTRTSPDTRSAPTVAPGDDLDVFPFAPTLPRTDVTPRNAAPTPSRPPSFEPFSPDLDPQEQPASPVDAGGCNCVTTKEKPKKPKKKEPRRVCYRGTYTEKSRSLSKSPKEEVPCQ
jgi:hypothetical protein